MSKSAAPRLELVGNAGSETGAPGTGWPHHESEAEWGDHSLPRFQMKQKGTENEVKDARQDGRAGCIGAGTIGRTLRT
jgi:hypothetical protein